MFFTHKYQQKTSELKEKRKKSISNYKNHLLKFPEFQKNLFPH